MKNRLRRNRDMDLDGKLSWGKLGVQILVSQAWTPFGVHFSTQMSGFLHRFPRIRQFLEYSYKLHILSFTFY